MAWTPYSTENSMSCTLVILSSMFELNLDMGSAQHEVTDLSPCWQSEYSDWTTVRVQWIFQTQVRPILLHRNDIKNKVWQKKECLLHGCVLKYIETGKWLFRSDLNSMNYAVVCMKKPFSCYDHWFWLSDFRQFLFDQTNFVF